MCVCVCRKLYITKCMQITYMNVDIHLYVCIYIYMFT